jgi:hypothetical protein
MVKETPGHRGGWIFGASSSASASGRDCQRSPIAPWGPVGMCCPVRNPARVQLADVIQVVGSIGFDVRCFAGRCFAGECSNVRRCSKRSRCAYSAYPAAPFLGSRECFSVLRRCSCARARLRFDPQHAGAWATRNSAPGRCSKQFGGISRSGSGWRSDFRRHLVYFSSHRPSHAGTMVVDRAYKRRWIRSGEKLLIEIRTLWALSLSRRPHLVWVAEEQRFQRRVTRDHMVTAEPDRRYFSPARRCAEVLLPARCEIRGAALAK